MQKPYIYFSPQSTIESDRAFVVLPEIYGLNAFVRGVADRFAADRKAVGLGLDHFFAVTGVPNNLSYDEHEAGMKLAGQMTGAGYMKLLTEALDALQEQYPNVLHITIVGFCFGGKLAYLSGVDKRVDQIISFYGGSSLQPNFYAGGTVVHALAASRPYDKELRVLGLFGEQDEVIPANDRERIKTALEGAEINTTIKVYPAGHAFFNQDRADRYNETAAQQAWQDLILWLS